jgi:tetratricopeptide (TPR) repeat protein
MPTCSAPSIRAPHLGSACPVIHEPTLMSSAQQHREVLRLMQSRQWSAAAAAVRALNARYPDFAPGWFAASHIAMAQGAAMPALEAIDTAIRLDASNATLRLHRANCLLALGRRQEALAAADDAERRAPADPKVLDAVGTARSHAGQHARALAAYDRAVELAPADPRFRYNRASVRRFVGDLAGAEADYDEVIARQPDDFEAYLNRSDLRRQTAERNHIAELETLADRPFADWRGEVQIGYALAKEYEDLGEWARSFAHLKRAAAIRRAHMAYDVATDVATVDWIIEAFPGVRHADGCAARPPAPSAPIFIVGLPRSGTTLVERILGSHSAVTAAGELDCFALALVAAARRQSGQPKLPRRELVALSATLDFPALGADYLRRARDVVGAQGRFIDKMPLNYLYCGLIQRALPDAKIIHMHRHPLAAGYAMYKTLFKDGYPFSYDLADIASYYAAYRRLMAHWRSTLPGGIYDLAYEDLIADQEGETRKLLDYCGLDWEDACAAFHQNPAASTTASASQVRRPLYDSSVAQWRHYESELEPLRAALELAGLAVATT